ncbi:hypothetical protein AAMO2058_000743600 [Amorphochlora amoebiformis]
MEDSVLDLSLYRDRGKIRIKETNKRERETMMMCIHIANLCYKFLSSRLLLNGNIRFHTERFHPPGPRNHDGSKGQGHRDTEKDHKTLTIKSVHE